VAPGLEARPHRLEVDPVGGGVQQDVGVFDGASQRVDVAGIDARRGRLAGAVLLGHRARLFGVEVEQCHARHLLGLGQVVDDRRRDRSRRAQYRYRDRCLRHRYPP
jgi:hypothetical protein